MVKFVRKAMPAEALTEKSNPSEKLEGVISYFRLRVHIVSFLCFLLFKENDFEYDMQAFTYTISETFVNSFHNGNLESKRDMMVTLYKVGEVCEYLQIAHVVSRTKDKIVYLDDLFYLTSKEYLEEYLGKYNLNGCLEYIKRSYRELLATSKKMSENE